MARLRFGRPISLRWNGLLLQGPANTVFEIPDEYYEEFNQDIGPVEPTLVWLDSDEGATLRGRVTALEGAGTTSLSNDAALALGTAASGTGSEASRDDHVHPTTGLALSGHNHDAAYAPIGDANRADIVFETCKNSSGTTIAKGKVVYIDGADGTNPTIALADADSEATSSKTLGFTETSSNNGDQVNVITHGRITNIDTSAASAEGVSVWLSGTAGGYVFGAPPAEPAHSVYLGVVTKKNVSTGEIFVKVQNGYELDELHDVSVASPSAGDIIQWATDGSNYMWRKKSLTDAGAALSSHNHDATYATTGHNHSGVYETAGAVSTHNSSTTSVHGITNTSNLVYTSDSRLSDARTPTAHTHVQADSHNSPDTDSATTSLHHTIGTGANQAAAGNHSHTGFLASSGGALTGDLTLNAQADLRLADSDSSHWVALQAPSTVASNVTWTLPSTDGTNGQVLSTNGTGILSWIAASSGGTSVNVAEFTSSGTWTKPSGVTAVYVLALGGGGGGGGGSTTYGGGGGGGASVVSRIFQASILGSTASVTIGAGGTGGAAGANGNQGGTTIFNDSDTTDANIRALGGGQGPGTATGLVSRSPQSLAKHAGSVNTPVATGNSFNVNQADGCGGESSTSAGTQSPVNTGIAIYSAGGGGAGSGTTAGTGNYGRGGLGNAYSTGWPSGGAASGGAGGSATQNFCGGAGGGGNSAGTGGVGGDGKLGGGGGGGGRGSTAGGAGGNGGDGYCLVISW